MKYYLSEKQGKGYLKSGFKVMTRKDYTLDDVMKPCYEFESDTICKEFGELLANGFNLIYRKYKQPEFKIGDKIYWISTYSQSHLRNLIIPKPHYCKDPELYRFNYTFRTK